MLPGFYLQKVSRIYYLTLLRLTEPQHFKTAPEEQSKFKPTCNSSKGAISWIVTVIVLLVCIAGLVLKAALAVMM